MKIDRIISIIMILLEQKTITAPALAKMFEVSTRTIYRDIDTIGQSGIPIVTYQGQNGGIGIMEQYKVDKRIFTVSDITSLLIGLGGINSALTGNEITNTLAKIKGMIPEQQLAQVELLTNQIAIDLTPWTESARLDEMFKLIKSALANNKTLKFQYTNVSGRSTSREIEPYRLLHKGSSWYLQGYCLLRNEFRTFRFYRIENLKLTENSFEPRKFDQTVFESSDTSSMPMVEVFIRFDETILKSITEFYGEGVITSCEDGIYTAGIMVLDNENGYNTLFMYGDKCECLAPSYIRDYIRKKALMIAKMHKNNAVNP